MKKNKILILGIFLIIGLMSFSACKKEGDNSNNASNEVSTNTATDSTNEITGNTQTNDVGGTDTQDFSQNENSEVNTDTENTNDDTDVNKKVVTDTNIDNEDNEVTLTKHGYTIEFEEQVFQAIYDITLKEMEGTDGFAEIMEEQPDFLDNTVKTAVTELKEGLGSKWQLVLESPTLQSEVLESIKENKKEESKK